MIEKIGNGISDALKKALIAIGAMLAGFFLLCWKGVEHAAMLAPKMIGGALNGPSAQADNATANAIASERRNVAALSQTMAKLDDLRRQRKAATAIEEPQPSLADIDSKAAGKPLEKTPNIIEKMRDSASELRRPFESEEARARFVLHVATQVSRGQPLPIGMSKLDTRTRLWLEAFVLRDQSATKYLASQPYDVVMRHLNGKYHLERLPQWPSEEAVKRVDWEYRNAREAAAHMAQQVVDPGRKVGEEDIHTRSVRLTKSTS